MNGRIQGEGSFRGEPIEMGSRPIRVPIAAQATGAKGIDGNQDHVPSRGWRAGLGMAGDHPREGWPIAKSVSGSMDANLTPGREGGQTHLLDIQVRDLSSAVWRRKWAITKRFSRPAAMR